MVRQFNKLTALSKVEGQAHHIEKIILLLIIGVFVVHALSLNFTQDDAFISYRYVRNFVNGQGLVFNPGERVEGYTNFLWVIILSLFAKLGLDIIVVSKMLGIASGCMALFLIYKISVLVWEAENGSRVLSLAWFFPLFPSLLLSSNSAFAYWSISGLETAFFVMAVLLSVYFSFTNERLMILSSALSTLIRPEGVLIFAILILHKFFFKKDGIKNCLSNILSFTLLLLPFLVFKILYYGNLLPNPFYAKTGLSWEYLKTGMGYFWLFLRHYGLWGLLYLIPIVLYRNLEVKGKLLVLMVYIYTLYIIMIGGDVLKAHRFFLPVLPFLYLLFSLALMRLYLLLKKEFLKPTIPIILVIAFSILTFWLPRNWIMSVRSAEISLCTKMSRYAQALRQSFGTDFTLAMTTIGVISYLTEVKVIDMLGLTDPYIAKHPEKIPGISSTWKEKKFNTQYLLSRDPEVIMFSTGIKPSAPAERALFLSSKFRQNYYPYYLPGLGEILMVVYKKKGPYLQKNEIFPDARFVNLYNEVINLERRGDLQTCLEKLEEILEVGPSDFAQGYEYMGKCNFKLGNIEEGKKYAQKAIQTDDYCTMSHVLLSNVYLREGDTAAALLERNKVRLYNPEILEAK